MFSLVFIRSVFWESILSILPGTKEDMACNGSFSLANAVLMAVAEEKLSIQLV